MSVGSKDWEDLPHAFSLVGKIYLRDSGVREAKLKTLPALKGREGSHATPRRRGSWWRQPLTPGTRDRNAVVRRWIALRWKASHGEERLRCAGVVGGFRVRTQLVGSARSETWRSLGGMKLGGMGIIIVR